MSEEDSEPELTEWEQGACASLEALGLPRWEYKARAATYLQGHRGILDLDLDFPKEYLKGPAVECYVWKTEVEDGTRVHAYADVDGNTFHLQWQTEREPVQHQPNHLDGSCDSPTCSACQAATHIAAMCRGPGA